MFDIDNIFEEVWKEESTASQSDLTYVEKRLDYHFPEEFRELYMKMDGFRARTGELYLDIWNLDEIISFNEIYEDEIDGEFVFFASSDESSDGYAYEKTSNKIFTFPIDCGVEMDEKVFCADGLEGLFQYWKMNG